MSSTGQPVRRFFRWCWSDIHSGETIDLWLLLAASLIFTVLGTFGIASVPVLSSVVLALLALLAVSQIRGRQEVRTLVSSWQRGRTGLFEAQFPDSYYEARSRASQSYYFAGLTMQRTLPTMRPDLLRLLDNNKSVRILLPDPDNDELMQMVAASRRFGENAASSSSTIRQTLDAAKNLRGVTNRTAEVRTASLLPRVGLNVIDGDQPDALIMVQMYQFQPTTEPGPIFILRPSDGEWFTKFHDEFERLWSDGSDWT